MVALEMTRFRCALIIFCHFHCSQSLSEQVSTSTARSESFESTTGSKEYYPVTEIATVKKTTTITQVPLEILSTTGVDKPTTSAAPSDSPIKISNNGDLNEATHYEIDKASEMSTTDVYNSSSTTTFPQVVNNTKQDEEVSTSTDSANPENATDTKETVSITVSAVPILLDSTVAFQDSKGDNDTQEYGSELSSSTTTESPASSSSTLDPSSSTTVETMRQNETFQVPRNVKEHLQTSYDISTHISDVTESTTLVHDDETTIIPRKDYKSSSSISTTAEESSTSSSTEKNPVSTSTQPTLPTPKVTLAPPSDNSTDSSNTIQQFLSELRVHTIMCLMSLFLILVIVTLVAFFVLAIFLAIKYLGLGLVALCKKMKKCYSERRASVGFHESGSLFPRCDVNIRPYNQNDREMY